MGGISWSLVWRGGLLALGIVLAVSTQLLFQLDLYENWPLPAIMLGWLDYLGEQLIVGAAMFASVIGALLIPARSSAARAAWILGAVLLGALSAEMFFMHELAWMTLLAKVARWLVIAGLACALFALREQALRAEALAHEKRLQRINLDRQTAQARLESLRAQIEPHFLFNTLANVQRLYRTDAENGRRMLASFIAYLRAALPRLRENETTLREEVALVRAYLDVLQVRMGERLQVRFEMPEELGGRPFPPLALSTLAENAIKHGLNPLPAGGSIEIRAWSDDRYLRVCVADTGAGLRAHGGSGAGLANLRARLGALYGDEGVLDFEANLPCGIRATIAVPLRPAVAEAG